MFPRTRVDLAKSLLCLLAALSLGGCANHRLKRALRRKDLSYVNAAAPQARAGLSPKWRRRYAKLLSDQGELQAAQLWWLGSYLRGADLQALEALAVSHAKEGAVGFAAAQFAQVLATERGAIEQTTMACQAWTQRKKAREQAGAYVSAQRDERRLAALCGPIPPDQALAQRAGAQRRARQARPGLIAAFPPAFTPAFLKAKPARLRQAPSAVVREDQVLGPKRVGQGFDDPVASRLIGRISGRISGEQGLPSIGPWLSGAPKAHTPMAGRELLAAIGQDPTLGPTAAGLCALLGARGHRQALSILQDNLRASASLQSGPSSRLRVILALVQGNRERSIFWMRLGASQVEDLGAWWLWCARWAALTGQRAATKIAYQSLTKLVAPQSPARWTLSWWRLRQKIFELGLDPYLQKDAPNTVARASLRSLWAQFLASLPQEHRPGVWPALVDDLVFAGWDDTQIHRLGALLFGAHSVSVWRPQILVSRAKQRWIQTQPLQALALESSMLRGQAWRQLWSKAGVRPASIAQYWGLMEQDPAWSPRVDPFAALSVLISRPRHWGGQD